MKMNSCFVDSEVVWISFHRH